MKNPRCLPTLLCTVFVVGCFHVPVLGQSAQDKNRLAAISASRSSVRWEMAAPYSVLTLTVAAPDGRVFRKELKAGASPEFMLTDQQGERLPDGQYTYELRLTPVFSTAVKERLAAARGKDDDPEAVRAERKHSVPAGQPLVQSGTFSILNGAAIVAGAVEAGARRVGRVMEQAQLPSTPRAAFAEFRPHHLSLIGLRDQVIPDDLIVQGSACVGLDCVNNESFGFDTIRMKENNTRLQFLDTSTAAGFPTNNWQIRANSSASGGGSFLGFVDQGADGSSETGTIVFEVDAGAPANSVKVASTGKVGLRTATPVLDVHANTSDTPAIRLEQNNSGGFTAQTWDMAGNEANFFVRDVTGGSQLPFRIRPGAPTSSLDIAASGDVGVGTSSPAFSANTAKFLAVDGGGVFSEVGTGSNQSGTSAVLGTFAFFNRNRVEADKRNAVITGVNDGATNSGRIVFFTANAGPLGERLRISSSGNVGIGTAAPDQLLTVNGGASKPGGGSWAVFSDERLKIIKGPFNSGLKAVMQLQPLRYEYKRNNDLDIPSKAEHVGFGAQTLQKIIPEAVTTNDQGYLLVNNDPILWTMLNAIKEQQKEIEQLRGQVRKLQAASRTRK